MDPEKVLAQIKKALGLDESATREQILAALDGIAKLQEARKGETSDAPDAPEEPEAAAASKPEDDATKLDFDVDALRSLVAELAKPEDESTSATTDDADATKADVDGGQATEAELMDEALSGEAMAAIGLIAEATGMDPAAVIAGLRDNADGIAQLLSGQGDGTPAEDQAGAMSRDVALRASKARVEALEASRKRDGDRIAKLEKQVAKATEASDAVRVGEAIGAGHILPGHRDLFLSLARSNREEFEAQLTAAKGTPAVPTEDLATGKGSKPEPGRIDDEDSDPKLAHLARTMRNAKIPEARIKAELERARKQDFEGRA